MQGIGHEGHAYFDREYFELTTGKRRFLRYLTSLLSRWEVAPGGRVLDVGSGYGFLVEALRERDAAAFGVELAPLACTVARGRCGPVFARVSAEGALPFADGTFSAIYMNDVIEHLADFSGALRECRRVLAPGGKLFVLTLNSWSVARIVLGKRWSWFKDPTHVHMFSVRSLRRAVAEAGLVVRGAPAFFNFCSVGESTPALKPLQRIARVVPFPFFGDAVLVVGERRSGAA